MIFDFHTHTFLSDGELLPMELIRRALVKGYRAIGITDHASLSNVESVVQAAIRDCALAEKHWEIKAIPGVEITHVPAAALDEVAKAARKAGAKLIVVHGETPVEPVEPGTNRAAVGCPEVDILAHPGKISLEEAKLAVKNEIFLEITARKGHCLSNGWVAATARQAGAQLLLNSDTHSSEDLLTRELVENTCLGAGLDSEEIRSVVEVNPQLLIERLA